MNGQPREASHPPPASLHAMAEAAPTPVVLISRASALVLYANRMGRLLAHDPTAVVSLPTREAFPIAIAAGVDEVRRTGQPSHLKSLWLPPAPHRAEASFWDIDCTPVPGVRAGEMPCVLLTAHDVTHHMQARQEAVASNAEHLNALLKQIPAAVFVVDSADGVAPFQNDYLRRVLGNPSLGNTEARETLRGWALHEDGTPYCLEEYPSRRAFALGETIEAEPMIYRKPDGTTVNLELFASPIRDGQGRITAAVAVVYDVTERQRERDALRESQDRLQVAIEAGGLATWEIDLVQGITQMDANFSKLLGLPAQTFRGSRDEGRSFIHPDDADSARAALEAAIAAKGELHVEARAIAADGRVLWLAYTGRVILDPKGQPLRVAGVVRDVTESRAREKALREALASRELLVREADHRIKNSLQLICSVLTLQMMRLPTPEITAALGEAISRVQAVAEAHRALHQSADLRTVDFAMMLSDLCRHAERLSPSVVFRCECPAPIELDTERAIPLGLLISELLTNAAKYAYVSEGAVAVSATRAAGQIVIRVVDQGRGMPQDGRSGGGIGARIIGAIARQIGARVETASGPGGTAVTLSFAQNDTA